MERKDIVLRALIRQEGKIIAEVIARLGEMRSTRPKMFAGVADFGRAEVNSLLGELVSEGLAERRPRTSLKPNLQNGGHQPMEYLLTEAGLARIGTIA